jgi:hypothetical protein
MGSSVDVGSACCDLLHRDAVTGVYTPVTKDTQSHAGHKRASALQAGNKELPIRLKMFRLSRALWTFNHER